VIFDCELALPVKDDPGFSEIQQFRRRFKHRSQTR
jgi:hypothetical protein